MVEPLGGREIGNERESAEPTIEVAAEAREAKADGGILALQRAAGNRAVSRALGPPGGRGTTGDPSAAVTRIMRHLSVARPAAAAAGPSKIQRAAVIQREPDKGVTAPTAAPATEKAEPAAPTAALEPPFPPKMSRADFDKVMTERFGVAKVKNGDYTDQNKFPKKAKQTPTIDKEGWTGPWKPKPDSSIYTQIASGFEQMQTAAGVPKGIEIYFYDVEYEVSDESTGTTTKQPETGADFSGKVLNIYRKFLAVPEQLPIGRATRYNAPLDKPDDPMARTTIHELAHGLAQVADVVQPDILKTYATEIGWHDGMLYDIGAKDKPKGEQDKPNGEKDKPQDEAAGGAKPRGMMIHRGNWQSSLIGEQPISEYMASGGPGEDFAEAVKAYVVKPKVLEQRSPHRYEFISSRVASWRAEMKKQNAAAP